MLVRFAESLQSCCHGINMVRREPPVVFGPYAPFTILVAEKSFTERHGSTPWAVMGRNAVTAERSARLWADRQRYQRAKAEGAGPEFRCVPALSFLSLLIV